MTVEISKCRSCNAIDLRSVLDLGDQFIVNFVEEAETAKPDKAPLHLVVCNNCRLVQLKHTVDPERLFRQFWYYSGVNNTMKEHLYELMLQTTQMQNIKAGDWVIDIGANDGELLGNYPRNINSVGVEPARNMIPLLKKNCTYALNDYFSELTVSWFKERHVKAKHIYAIAMFYDVDKPEEFLDNIKEVLDKDGIFVIQMNYLKTMLQNVAVDNILHEHIMYYNIQSLEPILTRCKLKIFHVSFNDINGGSIRIYICHEETDKMTYFNYLQAIVDENKWFGPGSDSKLYGHLDFFRRRVSEARDRLQTFVRDEHSKHKTIYAYGASTRGTALLQVMNLKYPIISAAVEKNPLKVGKRMSGLEIPIISEQDMREAPPDYLLILPYFFFQEFNEREATFLADGGRFIVPLPNPFIWDGIVQKLL